MAGKTHSILAGRRILVVEDEPLIALHDRDMLREWGCEVIGTARSVPNAIALIQSQTPDAVLLDVSLQGHTSEPVAEMMIEAGVPFIVTTAFAARTLRPSLRGAPILRKPVEERKLEKALTDLFTQ